MILQAFKKKNEIALERSYPAPVARVWRAWTDPEDLQQWWGPEKTTVAECEVELRVGGRLLLVTEAGPEMGKYEGTRWPMEGSFTEIEENSRLVYEARSWTEGEEEGTTIRHVNEITFSESGGETTVRLHVEISDVGPKAKMAVMGMKWGYKSQLDKLEGVLGR